MKNDRGQVIIILLLVMMVGLTIGLSVVSRSLLNVKQSTQTEESSRAFTAAEAGIEVALESGTAGSDVVGDSRYDCTKDPQGSGPNNVFYNLEKDKVAQLYFTSEGGVETRFSNVNNIRMLWGVPGSNIDLSTPALEVNLIYKNTTDSTYHLAKFALDPNSTRANSNRFCKHEDDPCSNQPLVSSFDIINGTEFIDTSDVKVYFNFGANLDVSSFNTEQNLLIFGRFRFLYNPTPSHLGIIATGGDLPSQGSIIDCLGTVAQTGVSRRIKVFENHPAVPEVFDYVLFNGNPSQSLGH